MMGREYNIPARASPTRILSPRQQHELHPPKRAPSQHRMSCLLGGTPAVCHSRKLHPGPWLGSSTALPPAPPGEKKKSDNFLTINNVFLYVKLRSLWSLLNHRILGPGPGESEELGKPAPWNASPSVSWDYCGTATSRSSARSDGPLSTVCTWEHCSPSCFVLSPVELEFALRAGRCPLVLANGAHPGAPIQLRKPTQHFLKPKDLYLLSFPTQAPPAFSH